jgi:DNA-binding NtrC family response regulator
MESGMVTLAHLLGRCAGMERLKSELLRFGPTELTVHVFGETETGKELVARALHDLSPRSRRPCVAVNVAGFTDELLAAELFGHAKGAFTGAACARDGWVAAADGGTLFIDEVAELSPVAQVRLLRFLQEKQYQRVGETASRRADVRLVSATNVDLAERVRRGRFRADLWYRLKGEVIAVPPLRERGDDVVLLARQFLRRHAGACAPARLSADAERALAAHTWPGNVRELEHEMHRLSICAAGRVAEVDDLSPHLRSAPARGAGTLQATLRRTQLEVVRRALERNSWVIARAAAELGISRQALWQKLRTLDLADEVREKGRRGTAA